MPIIREKVVPNSIVSTDSFVSTDDCKSYDVLDVSEFKHERINHGEELVDDTGKHINGLENF
jgi:transposase